MQCEFEAQAKIVQNYWRIIRTSVQKILREGDNKSKTTSNSITKENIKSKDIEKREFAFTMSITAYVSKI